MAWSFSGASFEFLDESSSGRSPDWRYEAETQQIRGLGTDRFVDLSNGGRYLLRGTVTIAAGAGAAAAYAALQSAYRNRTVATLADGDGGTWTAIIQPGSFDVAPLVGGAAGYEGAIVFGRPNG